MVRVAGVEPALLSELDFEVKRVFPGPIIAAQSCREDASCIDAATPRAHLASQVVEPSEQSNPANVPPFVSVFPTPV